MTRIRAKLALYTTIQLVGYAVGSIGIVVLGVEIFKLYVNMLFIDLEPFDSYGPFRYVAFLLAIILVWEAAKWGGRKRRSLKTKTIGEDTQAGIEEMNDEKKQDALAQVYDLAGHLHALRGLSDEVETLLADSIREARQAGLNPALIGEAANVPHGRITEVSKAEGTGRPSFHTRERTHKITGWPGDALQPYLKSFAGRMIFPPYPGRRRTTR